MFEAFVLACLISHPHVCVTLQDMYGPYEEEEQCVVRTEEIAFEVPTYMPNYYVRSVKCVDMDDKVKI